MKWKQLAAMLMAFVFIAQIGCASALVIDDDDVDVAGAPIIKPVKWGPDVRPPQLDAKTNKGRMQKVNENIEGVKSHPETSKKYNGLTSRQKECLAFHVAYIQSVLYQSVISPAAPAQVFNDAAANTKYFRDLLQYWCEPRDPGVQLYTEYVDEYVGNSNARNSLVRRVQDGEIVGVKIQSQPEIATVSANMAVERARAYMEKRERDGISVQDVSLAFMALGLVVSGPVLVLP